MARDDVNLRVGQLAEADRDFVRTRLVETSGSSYTFIYTEDLAKLLDPVGYELSKALDAVGEQ